MRALVLLALTAGLARAEAPLPTHAAHEVVHVPPSPFPIRGPRFAPVTLDLYVQFGHNPSAAGSELVRRAVERANSSERNHGPDVREVLHLGLMGPVTNSPGAELAAEAMLEADAEERVWPFVNHLVRERGLSLSAGELGRVAREAGLDGARFDAALADHRHLAAVEWQLADAQAHGHSAGELLVNGRRSSVWASDEGLQTAIDEGRRRAEALLDAGVPLSQIYDQLAIADEPPPGDGVTHPRRRNAVDLTHALSRGPALAPVTMVLFSNLACVPCAALSAEVSKLREAHPGAVREVWKNVVPPYARLGIDGVAAELAVGAAAQGRFWELHDQVIAAHAIAVRRSRVDLEAAARAAGLDWPLLDRHQRDGVFRGTVEREQQEARELGVPFAPAVLINGILVVGAPSFERLDRIVRGELERGIVDRLTR